MIQSLSANILLAHGSRDPKWQAPFEAIKDMIKQQAQQNAIDSHLAMPVELAYMELCEPSLERMCEQLALEGYQQINIYPLFFAAGRHLRIDVPQQLTQIENKLGIKTLLHPPVGQKSIVQEAVSKVILQQL
ncbi:MAG: CbiX/SirB N-terminal domain-containing protein [Oleispira sp.]|jgi:sirohydrochlorin cobaltochelatase|nr:CbiX/SirB N-terminal domain-containing protein [Oleispira sp.]